MTTSPIVELQAELERLFELEELLGVARDLLGIDPERVGGTAARGSFAQSLVGYAVAEDAIEALCDAVLAERPDAAPIVARARLDGVGTDTELQTGATLGDYTIVRRLGEDRVSHLYLARKGGVDHRVRVLKSEATRDRRGLQRYLTVTRLIARLEHQGLPGELVVGPGGPRPWTAHRWVEGQPLGTRIARSGPLHINEARPLLLQLLGALDALHEKRLAHGALSADSVVVTRDGAGQPLVLLLDAGTDRLRARPRGEEARREIAATVVAARTVAPELVRGATADARSDVYMFGAVMFELLTGKAPFGEGLDAAVGHLSKEPPSAAEAAPRGWVAPELDALLRRLLAKNPAERPASAGAVFDELSVAGRVSLMPRRMLGEEELTARIDAVIAAPADEEKQLALEGALEEGGDAERIANAFELAADSIEASAEDALGAKKSLLFRAARVFEHADQNESALHSYRNILGLDAADATAQRATERLLRKLRRFDDLIEGLLGRTEQSESASEKARAFAEIAAIYQDDLKDPEQALVAMVQALCEDAGETRYAEAVEELAGSRQDAWNEVLSLCLQTTEEPGVSAETKRKLYLLMAGWYETRLSRSDQALAAYQAIVAAEPSNDAALAGMTRIYRKAQQWLELGMVLMTRADASATPALARDLRAEAAEILEHQLGDVGRARDLYEQILGADPGHARSVEALAAIYARTNEHARLAKLLERQAEAQRGEERLRTLARIAELHEDQLGDAEEAKRRYEDVLSHDPSNLDALRGIDRILSKAGKYAELIENLRTQVSLAATPRQKIALHQRIAGLQEEEFLDHAKAAEAWEAVLALDPGHDGALSALARHYRVLSRFADAATIAEKHASIVTDSKRQLDLLLSRARLLTDQLDQPTLAMAAFEAALAIDPEHAGALEALARLREKVGDADAALKAIETLALSASTPTSRAEHFVRAAKLLEQRGDADGAIERLNLALDAQPADRNISALLRRAYVTRGDAGAAIALVEKELERTEGAGLRARLFSEIAVLAYEQAKDSERAERAAKQALDLDPTQLDAARVLGNVAYEAERFLEASRHLGTLMDRVDVLTKEQGLLAATRLCESLQRAGNGELALAAADVLLRLGAEDAAATERAARVIGAFGSTERIIAVHETLLERFAEAIGDESRAAAQHRLGDALRKDGKLDRAVEMLKAAVDADPSQVGPLASLSRAHEDRQEWELALRVKTDQLDLVGAEDRIRLFLEIGELSSSKLKDTARATKAYVAALEERPDDRRVLTRLMQLYSEAQDWSKLVEVVVRLAEFAEPAQKAKYWQTAAIVSARQLQDPDEARRYFGEVLTLEPKNEKVLAELIGIERSAGRWSEVETLLEKRLGFAREREDKDAIVGELLALAELYEKELGALDKAIDALEAVAALAPDAALGERLAKLYSTDPARWFDRALALHQESLKRDPYRPEPYKKLRKLYTENKQADPAWCLCQAITVLNLADVDEERFYKRMRPEGPAAAQAVLTEEQWASLLVHPDVDPLLTSVFALIEPAVLRQRAQPADKLGFRESDLLDLPRSHFPLAQTLHWAAAVMGMQAPPTFRSDEPIGLAFAPTVIPSVVLGRGGQAREVPPSPAAFIAARQLVFYRPGFAVRQLVQHGTGLRAWLFAAIRLIAPQFPVAADISGLVQEAGNALAAELDMSRKDQLARVVSTLLQSGGSLDLKRWVAGVDLTADRAGMLLAHDLEATVELVRASDAAGSSVSSQERLKQLVLFSVSPAYFELRRDLGITIDV